MGAIFFHCASVSNGPDRAIGPPLGLLTLLTSHLRKLNYLYPAWVLDHLAIETELAN
jgi:hypothetical protein